MQPPTAQESVPPLSTFVRALLDDGVAAVSTSAVVPAADPETERLLRTAHGTLSRNLAGNAPEFSLISAVWAVRIIYQLCRFVVCRDVAQKEIVSALAENCAEERSPSVVWSADLTLRLLPEIFRAARHLSNADPLVDEIKKLAAAWPLSSVGIPDLQVTELESFIAQPALLQLYVDRIVTAGDASRLNDARVTNAIRATLGIHHELCPALAARLFHEAEPCDINPS